METLSGIVGRSFNVNRLQQSPVEFVSVNRLRFVRGQHRCHPLLDH